MGELQDKAALITGGTTGLGREMHSVIGQGKVEEILIDEGLNVTSACPFKGNIDLDRVEDLLRREGDRVPFGMITVTNNSGGGQPVSMENIRLHIPRELAKFFVAQSFRYQKPSPWRRRRGGIEPYCASSTDRFFMVAYSSALVCYTDIGGP